VLGKLKMDRIERISRERQSLTDFLAKRRFSLDFIITDIGQDNFDRLLAELASMKQHLEDASNAARNRDMRLAAQILGARAMVQKDNVYAVIMNAYGGPAEFIRRGIIGAPALLREYIMSKYEGGVRNVELLLNVG